MIDYADTLLGFIAGNWDADNYDPRPALFDGRDSRKYDDGRVHTSWELTKNAAVTVAPADEDREPEGIGYSHDRVDATTTIRVEAADESEYGTIADGDEFERLVDEVVRTLRVERKRPLPDVYRLEVRGRERQSDGYTDYYRTDLAVAFPGIDGLP